MPVFQITWVDHHTSEKGWWSLEEICHRAKQKWMITTIGDLVYEDQDCIVLVMETGPNGDGGEGIAYRKWTSIMKPLIQQRKELAMSPHKSGRGSYGAKPGHPGKKPKKKGGKK